MNSNTNNECAACQAITHDNGDGKVQVSVSCFACLMDRKLVIPAYQRPYTWDESQLGTMLDDFLEHMPNNKEEESKQPYYMGSLILHHDDKEGDNIVDGQQRLTTLLILQHCLKPDSAHKHKITYSNPASQKRIKKNYDYISKLCKQPENERDLSKIKDIFEILRFTTITTTRQDDAFIFFDTQNSRGITPSVTVLHKAYNLRYIDSIHSETQKTCARWWEAIDNKNETGLSEVPNQLEWLIKIFLWRVRHWRGDTGQSFGSDDELRDAFTKKLRDNKNDDHRVYFDNYAARYAARQPLYKGERFFKFVRHYGQLLDDIMTVEVAPGKTFRALRDAHKIGSQYMASFFTMICLVYYDRFGFYKFQDFVKKLSHSMAAIRIDKGSIHRVAMEKCFIRAEYRVYAKQNILDFICTAFDAQEVLEWWERQVLAENADGCPGVRGRFIKAYRDIFPKEEGNTSSE